MGDLTKPSYKNSKWASQKHLHTNQDFDTISTGSSHKGPQRIMQGPLTWILRLREDAARNTKRSPQKDPRRIIKGLLGEGFDFTWTFTRSSHQDLSKSVQKHYREAELAGSPQDLFRRICARSRKDFFMDFSTIITRSSQKDLCKIQQGPRRGCQHDLHNAL